MRVATEHRAEATHKDTRRALTAGSEKGVTRVLREASRLATKPWLLDPPSSFPAAATA